jgi:hypothetical protein
MIAFGLAEVATGFTHNFLGIISTANSSLATYVGAGIGAIYACAGVFTLTMKKRAATLAILCLVAVIIGRVAMALAWLYPLDSFIQVVSIVVGTAIAVVLAFYIALRWNFFT